MNKPTIRTLYQWQTSTGAVVCEFFSEKEATNWLKDRKEKNEHELFYSRLQLVKVETITARTVIIKATEE